MKWNLFACGKSNCLFCVKFSNRKHVFAMQFLYFAGVAEIERGVRLTNRVSNTLD
jgi:hypothetical protein